MPPFVGRAAELAALAFQLDRVFTGHGAIAIISGEPGIGKTRLAHEFASEARGRGARVLAGRCFEGEWAPPFGPWVEALAGFTTITDPAWLDSVLGARAPVVARLLPPSWPVTTELSALTPLGAEDERHRLVDALARCFLAIADAQSMVVLLDDLQWADPPSLSLLTYLRRFLPEARMLIVGVCRDAEAAPHHPCGRVLAELRRDPDFRQFPLVGLSLPETTALLATLGQREVEPALARSIQLQSNGNPLFSSELWRHHQEVGNILLSTDPHDDAATPFRAGPPDSIRHLLSRRLARLSPTTNHMLTLAAIIEGEFDFLMLQILTELEDEPLLDAVDEALASGLLRPIDIRRETYDFSHAIVRHTLAAEWSPSRRIRLHRRLAEAVERRYVGREVEHAATLAIQYHRSMLLPGGARGVPYALAEAERAAAASAPERAVTFLRIARDLASDLAAEFRCAILRRLALAEATALWLEAAGQTVRQTLALMEVSATPPAEQAAFLAEVAAALEDGGAPITVWQPLVERGLTLVGDRRDVTWARLKLTLKPLSPIASGVINASRWLGSDPEAIALGRAGDEDDFAKTIQPFDPRSPAETRALVSRARRWTRPAAVIRALVMAGADWLYYHGNLPEAIAVFEELRETAERYGAVSGQTEALIRLTIARIAQGEFDQARQTAQAAEKIIRRLGSGHHLQASAAWGSALFATFIDGNWSELAAFWTDYVANPGVGANALVIDDAALAAYAHARAGNAGAARRLLASLTPMLQSLQPTDWLMNGAVGFAGAAVWTLEADDLAPAYHRLARDLSAAPVGDFPGTSIPLTLARMATLTGNHVEAAEHFARARMAATTTGRRPLRPIVDLDEAKSLIRFGLARADRVQPLITAAVSEFLALGMSGWAERARALEAGWRRRDQPPDLVGGGRLPAGLTEREIAVVRLVARGSPDRAISQQLYVSPRTVQSHLRTIFRKTETNNRTELSIWAIEHGLVTPESPLSSG